MRRNSEVKRSIAAVLVLAFASGCAAPSKAPPRFSAPSMPPIPAPGATAPSAPTPPPAPATPPVAQKPEPPRPEPPRTVVPPTPAPGAPPTTPSVPPGQRGRFIVLNFDNADIETVIHAASEIVGFNYVIGPGVSGKKVTVQTSGRIPQEDVFGVLLAIMEVHGVTAVRSGNLYKIVPIEGARERAVPTIVGSAPDATRTGDEIVTQIIPIRFAPVNDLGTLLRPLISSKGTLIANRETGVLIITDSASNIARLLDIIRLVDVELALDELQIIPMQYADAAEMANILNQLFQSGRLRAGAAGAPAGPVPGVPALPGAPPAPGATGQSAGADRPPLIVPERRSNSIIVNARKGELETIRRVIEKLDVNVTGGRRVFIYYAENAKAKDLASTLNAIYGGRETVSTSTTPTSTGTSQGGRRAGEPLPPPPPPPTVAPGGPLGPSTAEAPLAEGQVRFIADEVTNAIIVTTTPRQWSDIEATIKQLDKMPRQVLIEVLVAEIALTDDTRLGLDWALKEGSFRLGQQSIAPTAPDSFSLVPAVSRLVPLAGGGLTAFAFASEKFFAILNTLASENRVNIVSNPHVLTSENKKAVINVSTSVPIITGQQTSTVSQPGTQPGGGTSTQIVTGGVNQTVEYRDAGVVLTVTPRIGERGTVALDVKQEVNSVGAAVPPTNSPSFVKREAETSVVLLNNQTLVLGGLIQDRITVDDRGIPLFKNIPILGYLFGFKEKKIEKTELLLLITPRVIGTALDAARITDEMRRVSPEVDEALRNAPRAPTSGPPPAMTPIPVPAPGPVLELPAPGPRATPPVGAAPEPAPAAPVPAPPPAGVPTIPQAPPAVVPPPAPPGTAPAPPPATPAPGTSQVPPLPARPNQGAVTPAPEAVPPGTAGPVGPPSRQLPRGGPPLRPRPPGVPVPVPVPSDDPPASTSETPQAPAPAAPPTPPRTN
jgi:general secretion pathway protein D